MLEELSKALTSRELRELGASLLRVADCREQGWHAESPISRIRWPRVLKKIKKNGFQLAVEAKSIKDLRAMRGRFLPNQIFGEPAWEILLEMFEQFVGGAYISIESLCEMVSADNDSFAAHIQMLYDANLIERVQVSDSSCSWVSLTERGAVSMFLVLEQHLY